MANTKTYSIFLVFTIILFSQIFGNVLSVYAQENTSYPSTEPSASEEINSNSEPQKSQFIGIEFLIGAIIALLSSLSTYVTNHLLKLREERIKREFEIRKEGMEFFKSLYGHISILSEIISSYCRAVRNENAGIISKEGFIYLRPEEFYEGFKEKYKAFSAFFYDCRIKGYEIYFPVELATKLSDFWAIIYLFSNGYEDISELSKIDELSEEIMTIIEEILGMPRKKV